MFQPTAPKHKTSVCRSDEIVKSTAKRPRLQREFSIERSTEWNYKTDAKLYYGPYAHIRKTMDYSRHSNYDKTRRWLHDSIVDKLMRELVYTKACEEYKLIASSSKTPNVIRNGHGIDVWALPKNPWLVTVTGEEGTNKKAAINNLMENDRLPLLGFILVDRQEIQMLLPENLHLKKIDADRAGKKESEYIAELLTLVALEAGVNVIAYGDFWDVRYYQEFFKRLKSMFHQLRIAFLHITTNNEAKKRADILNDASLHIDFACVLKMLTKLTKDIEIVSNGLTWSSFTKQWHQSSSWAPKNYSRRNSSFMPDRPNIKQQRTLSSRNVLSRFHQKEDYSITQFSIQKSTEENNASEDMHFYGPYAYIRKSLDYSYHSNYTRERQLLQDAIISEHMKTPKILDRDGNVFSTPKEPHIVFTAGAMGAGKSYVLNYLEQHKFFPLHSFVIADPDKIRTYLPEYNSYKSENPWTAGELTRKEAGYIVEILSLTAMEAGINLLVDGSLRDVEWYKSYFARIREEYSSSRISILHVDAPRDEIFKRAKMRGVITGRKIPPKTLEAAIEQVPKSMKVLKNEVDSYYKFNNLPNTKHVKLVSTEKDNWESFKQDWVQTSAWIPI